jgi:hypothetical protein
MFFLKDLDLFIFYLLLFNFKSTAVKNLGSQDAAAGTIQFEIL